MATAVRPLIGASDLVYALMSESSDVAGGTTTYGTIYTLPNLRRISINPNSAAATLFGDDGPRISAETIGEIDVEFEIADILPADEARILGNTYSTGSIVRDLADASPYIALGFKLLRSGLDSATAVYDYIWLYKGKMMKPAQDNQTKEDKINFQCPKLVGKFVARQSDNQWMIKCRTDDANAATITAGFFSTVVSQSTDATALTCTLSEGTVGNVGKIKLVFAKGSGSSFNIDASTLTIANVSTFEDTPESVRAGTFTTPEAGATVTVYFTPTVAYGGAATVAVIVNAGVKDTAGVACTQVADIITLAA